MRHGSSTTEHRAEISNGIGFEPARRIEFPTFPSIPIDTDVQQRFFFFFFFFFFFLFSFYSFKVVSPFSRRGVSRFFQVRRRFIGPRFPE